MPAPSSRVVEPAPRGPGGRRRDASRDDALRTVALELLAEIGYDALTMDAVAERAHAGKGTIYRRWQGKAELVVDALDHAKPPLVEIDTGSLRGDLYRLAAAATDTDGELDMLVMIGLVSALPRDPELRTAFREQLIAPRMEAVRAIFERAAARGEIPPVHNIDMLISLMPALMVHHVLLFGAPPERTFARAVIDEVLLPLAANPPAPPSLAPSRTSAAPGEDPRVN